jgi:putative transposase
MKRASPRWPYSLIADQPSCFLPKKNKRKYERILRKEFPHLREWCEDHLWVPSCFHGSVGNGWEVVEKYISEQHTHEYNREK